LKLFFDGLAAERMAFKATGEHTEKNKTGKISLFVLGAVSRCCIHYFRDVDYSFFKEVRMAYYTRFLIVAFPLFVVSTLVGFRLRIGAWVHGPKAPSYVSFSELQHSNLWFSGCCSFRLSSDLASLDSVPPEVVISSIACVSWFGLSGL